MQGTYLIRASGDFSTSSLRNIVDLRLTPRYGRRSTSLLSRYRYRWTEELDS